VTTEMAAPTSRRSVRRRVPASVGEALPGLVFAAELGEQSPAGGEHAGVLGVELAGCLIVPEGDFGLFVFFRDPSELDRTEKGVDRGDPPRVLDGLDEAAAGNLRGVGEVAGQADQAVEVLGIKFHAAFIRPAQFAGQHRLLHEGHLPDALAVGVAELCEACRVLGVGGGHPFGQRHRFFRALLGEAEAAEQAQRGGVGFGGRIQWVQERLCRGEVSFLEGGFGVLQRRRGVQAR
jgi:hypothetical protein